MAAFVANQPRKRGNLTGGSPKTIIVVDDGLYTATGSAEFGVIGDIDYLEADICISTFDAGAGAVLCLEGYNPASGLWETLISTGVIGTAISCSVNMGPATPNVTNNSANRLVRERMRVSVKHSDTKCIEYSITLHSS